MGYSRDPVVVEGSAVASPYDHNTAQPSATGVEGGGEKQPNRCRDPVFALLLYGNVAAIVAVAGIYGTEAFGDALDDGTSGGSFTGYVYATFALGALAILLSGITLPIMTCIPEVLIKASLILMLVLSAVIMVMTFLSGSLIGGIIGAVFFLIFLCYARAVWPRIPFASINLLTACTAIRENAGAIGVAFFLVALAFGWTILWSVALMGVWEKVVEVEEDEDGSAGAVGVTNNANYGYLFLLFLSYFFTHQVIQNTTHVTVAGTVGSWWFTPEDAGCCSSGLTGSLVRSLTTSFGSICFGSLLVAIVQALKALAQQARNSDNGILLCLAECILGCIESIIRYFNKWAFVYVGLYGYSYIEAGKNVFALFKNRGWEAIVADDLIGNVFFFLSLCVGGICAAVGYAGFGYDADKDESRPDGWFDASTPGDVGATCAVLGFVAGLVLSSILMSTIASAVNTVIVCFAEGPAEFEANHPELSRRMRETWLEFYPESGV